MEMPVLAAETSYSCYVYIRSFMWLTANVCPFPILLLLLSYFYPSYSTSLPYRIILTADIRSLNIHVPSEASTEPDLSFDGSSTFELCGTSRTV